MASLVWDLRGRRVFEITSPYKSVITKLILVCAIFEENAIAVTWIAEGF